MSQFHQRSSLVGQDSALHPLDVFLRQQAEFYFYQLAQGKISETEMNVELSKSILSRLISAVDPTARTSEPLRQMEAQLAENMVFLSTLYPQPKQSLVNRIIFEKITNFDQLDRVECDLLANLGISFERKTDRESILGQTEKFLNQLLFKAQETLPAFTSLLMNQLPSKLPSKVSSEYETAIKQSWRFEIEAAVTQSAPYDKDLISERLKFNSTAMYQAVYTWAEHLSCILNNPQSFLLKRKYLKMESSRQGRSRLNNKSKSTRIFKQSTSPSFQSDSTQEQEQHGNIFTNLYAKLRDFCKIRSDTEGFQTMDSFYLNQDNTSQDSGRLVGNPNCLAGEKYENFEFKESGYPIDSFLEVLEELQADTDYPSFTKNQETFLLESYLQTIKTVGKNQQNHRYTPQEKMVYSFSHNCYSFMEELLLERLVKLISCFSSLQQNAEIDYRKSIIFQDVDLVSFAIPDLLSARISGSEQLITSIYETLQELTKKREVRICKVDNNLMSADRSLTIVLKIRSNPVLCSIKLVLDNPQSKQVGSQTRQFALSAMNRFFNNVKDSEFGPISHLSSTLFSKDHRALYLTSIKLIAKDPLFRLNSNCYCGKTFFTDKTYFHAFTNEIRGIINQEGVRDLQAYRKLIPRSFVCGVCEQVIKKGQSLVPIMQCQDCGFKICVQCSMRVNPEMHKQIFVSLVSSVARIADEANFSQIQLRDPVKMNYNHQYSRDVKVLVGAKLQDKKQTHYHIIVEGNGFQRMGKEDSNEDFWNKIKKSIVLKNFPDYQQIEGKENNIGVLFRPSQLLKQKGHPFIFLSYNEEDRQFSKFVVRAQASSVTTVPIDILDIPVRQNDVFLPILWLFEEATVSEYITKVLKTNPFCHNRDRSQVTLDRSRLSKQRIGSQHFIR